MNEATARIAVAAATYWVDRPFSYRVPASLRERVVPGVRVVVPFGSGNRRTEGIVLSVGSPDREDVVLKPVSSVLDSEPVLSDEMLRLALWIRERYFCTVYDAVRAMLPAGLWYRMETVYVLCDGADREKAYGAAGDDERERTIVEALFAHGGTCPEEDIRRVFGRSDPSRALRSLVRKGIIRPDSTQKRRVGDKTVRMISLRVSPEEAAELALRKEKRAPLQSAALRLLCTLGRVSFSELSYFTGASSATVNALIKAGTVESSMEEVFRRGRAEWTETRPLPELNDEQRSAFEGIIALYDGANASVYGVPLRNVFCYGIYGAKQTGKTNLLKMCVLGAMKKHAEICIVDSAESDLGMFSNIQGVTYVQTEKELEHYLLNLIPDFVTRRERKEELIADGKEPDEIFDVMSKEFKPVFFFLAEIDQFISLIYKSSLNLGPTFENIIAKGSGNNIFFFGDLDLNNKAMVSGYQAFESFIGYKKGIHMGGKTAMNNMLNFEYLPYSEQNKSLKAGTGQLPDVTEDKETSRVVVPLVKKLSSDKKEKKEKNS